MDGFKIIKYTICSIGEKLSDSESDNPCVIDNTVLVRLMEIVFHMNRFFLPRILSSAYEYI